MCPPPAFTYRLPDPQLEWRDGVPYSQRFNDSYFSLDDGLAETRHVFIDGNRLCERWTTARSEQPLHFTIGETGFGSGLNFIATWLLWRELARPGDRLCYIATEAFPLAAMDCRRALARWPELTTLCEALTAQWPAAIRGQHRIELDDGGVVLDLLYGDSQNALYELLDGAAQILQHSDRNGVDAWFLDGFAPALNPEQWHDALYRTIAQLSARGATCASFTAAGHVRRALASAGFDVARRVGFGRKRHMLTATLTAVPVPGDEAVPWHRPPAMRNAGDAIVIGAGLAGCATAAALARRGLHVTVVDAAGDCASGGASAIPAALLYTRLSPTPGMLNRFTLHSFLQAQRHYGGHRNFHRSGVLQLMHTPQLQRHYLQLREQIGDCEWLRFLTAQQAAELARFDIEHPALYFPLAGHTNPQLLCREYLHDAPIEFVGDTPIETLSRVGQYWELRSEHGQRLRAPIVVIATAAAAAGFAQTAWLPLRQVRGQISEVSTAPSMHPAVPLCHDGYVLPSDAGLLVGASFVPNNDSTGLVDAEHRSNIEALCRAVPAFGQPADFTINGGFAAVRCTSPDYLPLIGAAPDADAFRTDYAALARDATQAVPATGRYLPGLYLNVAHGSRGLSATPVAADLIASLVCGEPRPLPASMCRALAPARFLVRGIKRGTLPHVAGNQSTPR